MPIQPNKPQQKKLQSYLLIFSSLLLLSAIPYFAVFGIENPSPVGAYLNGVFPSQTPSMTSSSDASYTVENAFPNLTFIDPLDMVELPNSNEFLVIGLQGQVWKFDNNINVDSKKLLLDLTDNIVVNADGGMLGLTLHPEYGQKGSVNSEYIYVYYRYTPVAGRDGTGIQRNGYMRLSRFSLPLGSNTIDPASEQILINIYDRHDWHNGGDMFFGPEDGFLYLSVGDEGGSNDTYEVTQQIDKWMFGGVLRIDVDRRGGAISHPIRKQPLNKETPPSGWPTSYTQNYYIPNDNPWLDANGGILEEFYAIGTRSPHRMTIDPPTGDIWLGDIGQSAKEEISLVRKGDNLQWPYREGDQNGSKAKPIQIIGNERPPIHAYDRTVGTCVIGGFVYRGAKFPELDGKYLFGDQTTQNVWTLNKTGENVGDVNYLLNVPVSGIGSKDGISSFFRSSSEDIYILDLFGTGYDGAVIRKVVRSGSAVDPPKKLSDLNIFTDLQALTPIPGIVPYDVNVPLWSDGAKKRRWIALPNDGNHNSPSEQIDFANEENWSFPAGTVAIKQFDLPTDENDPTKITKLETRFLVFTENNDVYGVSYKWNDAQTDAFLIGIDEDISQDYSITKNDGSVVNQTWNFPNRSQCIRCHNSVAGQALGLKTRQLNKSYTYPNSGVTSNQLDTWNHLNMFSEKIEEYTDLPASANISSTTANTEMKVRSYIDANCAFCHRPNGVEGAFDGRSLTALYDQSLVNGLPISHASVSGYKLVVPQEIENSLIYLRDNSTGDDRMPPIGRNLVDKDYIKLLEIWIDGLDKDGPDTITDGWYTFQAKHSSKFLAVENASQTENTNVIQISSNLEDNANWYVENMGNNKYRIKVKHSNMVLSLKDLRPGRGANVVQEPWNGNQHQLWYFNAVGQDYYRVINAYNSLELDVYGGSVAENTYTILWPKGDSPNQQWKIQQPATRVTGVTIDPQSISLLTKQTTTLTATILPSDATDESIVWSSSNLNIATIDENGNVTAISEGTTTITATTNDGDFTAESTVNVTSENPNLCSSSGTILMQRFDGISGVDISNLTSAPNYPSNPSFTSELSLFETTRNMGDNYGVRVSGYLCAPETGIYYFWVAGNNSSEISLSSTAVTSDKVRIAHHSDWTSNREWNKFSTQKSQEISLIQGRSYYIEALMKEGAYGDNLAVGWRKPSDGDETLPAEVIPGNVLSPFVPDVIALNSISLSIANVVLSKGGTIVLNPIFNPSSASDKTVSWSSSDDTIATVNANGLVTGISEGFATVTVTTNDNGFTSESIIEVTSTTPNTCIASGTILMERYDDISGYTIANLTSALNYPDNPSVTSELSIFEIPKNTGDNYGVRVSGYLCAPETGMYYFWVAGNNHTELSLSSDADTANKVRISHHEVYASNRQWNKFTTQKSEGIFLTQGDNYYIEALMKEGAFGDNLAAGWRKPSDGDGSTPTEVIPGSALSASRANSSSALKAEVSIFNINIHPNPVVNELGLSISGNINRDIEMFYVYDMSGKLVVQASGRDQFVSKGKYEINVSELTSGMYFIYILTDDSQQQVEKFIKE